MLFTGLGGTLLFALLLLFAFIFEKEIKNIALNELNKNLASQVHVRAVNLSFFENFPRASLRFDDVKIRESYQGSTENVVEAAVLSLAFNPLDIFRKDYRISRIILRDGKVNIKINRNGLANYLVWKSSGEKETDTVKDFRIALEKIEFQNVAFSYKDRQKKMDFTTLVKQADFKGTFSAKEFLLGTDAEFEKLCFSSRKVYYVKDKDIKLKSELEVNNTEGIFRIKHTNLEVRKANFDVAGMAQTLDKGTKLDFTVKSKDASIKTLLALLPAAYAKPFEDYTSDGKIHFNVSIKGLLNDKQTPQVLAEFGIRNGNIKEKNKKLALENVSFKGTFTNGKRQRQETSSLKIENFRARLGERNIAADLLIGNFTDPFITLGVMTNINLNDVHEFVAINGIKSLAGDLFINASFKGKVSDLKKNKFGRTTLAGNMSLKDVAIYPDSSAIAYTSLNGNFDFDGNNLDINNFSGNIGNSDFAMNGSFRNLASFIILPDQKLYANAQFRSKSLNLDEFLVTQYSKETKDSVTKFSLPTFLICDLKVDVQKLTYRKFEATGLTGNANFADNTLHLDGMRFNTMDGKVAMNGVFEGAGNERFVTRAKATITNINIEKLFYELENFDQVFITDNHLRGKLKAEIDFSALWNADLSVDMNSIKTRADLRIDNGELIKFDPLIKLGKYIKVKNMEHLRFSRLANNITIQNKVITIPEMEIKSSAVNMAVAGTHTFDNFMDYKMKVNVSQLFFGKREDYENEFGAVQVNENGGINFHLLMKGPADNVAISYDGNGLKKGIKKELQQQKEELKNIFTNSNEKEPANTNPKIKEDKKVHAQKDYELKWEDEQEVPKAPEQKEVNTQPRNNNNAQQSLQDLKNKLKATFK